MGVQVRLRVEHVWVVVGRYWRQRTRVVVYNIQDPRTGYITRKANRELRAIPNDDFDSSFVLNER
jgi:hypothetical protein